MAVSFVSSASNKSTTASVVINAPAGIQDGDILVAFVSVFRSTSATATSITGTGWTQWSEQITSTRYKCSMFWKRAAGESGNYTFSSASGTQMQGAIGVYRGCVASGDPRDVLSNTAYTTSGTIVRAASCTPTVANGMFVYGGWYYLAGTILLGTPSGMNARQTQANTNCAIRLADLAYTTTAASGTKDATAGATCTVKHAMMVALKPLVQTSPTVTLESPADGLSSGNLYPVLNFTATDTESDTVEYQVQVDTVNTFGSGTLIADALSATDTGFTAGHPFASGSAIGYSIQNALPDGGTYYWRVRAKDPSGTNTFGAWSSTRSFVIPPAFITSWKTDNAGTSTSAQIKLPFIIGYTPDVYVYWGDDSNSYITVYNQAETTHTYSVAGTYTVKMVGVNGIMQFANVGDRLKMLTISQWGCFKMGNSGYQFYGCENLTVSATDAPDLSATTILDYAFSRCYLLNMDVSNWNMSTIISVFSMFKNCWVFNHPLTGWVLASCTNFVSFLQYAYLFDQDISGINVTSATNMTSAIDESGISTLNYSNALKVWALLTVQTGVVFGATLLTYYASAAASRTHLTGIHGWVITDAGSVADPVTGYLIKYYTGTVFAQKTLKYYTGSVWATKPLKVYTGTEWIFVN